MRSVAGGRGGRSLPRGRVRASPRTPRRGHRRSGRPLTERARSIPRRSAAFRFPSGSRERCSEIPDTFRSTTTRRRSASSRPALFRRVRTSRSRSMSKTSTVTTSGSLAVDQPRAVERGMPRRIAWTISPVDRTASSAQICCTSEPSSPIQGSPSGPPLTPLGLIISRGIGTSAEGLSVAVTRLSEGTRSVARWFSALGRLLA